ncbi:MAG: hypothetical protein QXM52_05880 [Candidatus Bathyarchaeia archaeon]
MRGRSCRDENWGYAAIGRIPVVSADGTPLMPCKSTKAFKLLRSGKAFWKRSGNGKPYLKLRFNPTSTLIRPQTIFQPAAELDSSFLVKIRKEAKNRKVWYRHLSKVERGILDLTIKFVGQPKNPRLIDLLAKIVVKIKASLASPLQKLMGMIGKPLARKLSIIAKSWGNSDAEKWAEDEGFVKYLTVMDKTFQSLVHN